MKKITFAALAVPLMWVLLLLLFFNSSKLHAQETMVLSGVVKTADGTPMEGVTVWQQNTDNGTQTNEQGFYSLETAPNAVIVFEHIGFKTHTVRVTGKVLNVTLTADDDMLDEVVINAGYYSVKDKERTGSISKITAKEIVQQPVANPLAAMQGRMAGVNITQSSGTPGGGFDIQIRGRNSLRTEGNAPLYIVDGVPYASQSASDINLSAAVFAGNISPLNSINPNDIESIEVLKDADATAIYGSRGSNGVVLITTKKGVADKTSFSLQSTTSVSTVTGQMNLMDTQQYLKMRRDAFTNDGIEPTEYDYDVNGTWDLNRYTDWQKAFTGGRAVSQNTQFSLSGGTGRTSYLLSGSNRGDQMVVPGDFGYRRTNFLLNVNHKSKDDRFSLQANVQKSRQKNHVMAADIVSNVFTAPNAPALYDEEGNLNWAGNTFDNPMAKLNAQYFMQNNDLLTQLTLSYNLTDKLAVSINTGTSHTDMEERTTLPSTIYNPAYGVTSRNSSTVLSEFLRDTWVFEPKVSWSSSGTKGFWSLLAGATLEERRQQGKSITASNFTSNDFIMNLANAANQQITRDTETTYRYMAVFARMNYNHLERYIVNVTARRDGSSRFGTNNRFANFGAVGAAWLFSRENALENSSWLNFGKLCASYGIAGSDLIGDYQYLNTFGISPYKYDGNMGLEPLRLYNPDFSWETTKKMEAALELELFNGRLAPSVAWYRNRSSNQLVGIPLPATTGFSSVQANLGATVENSGWEFGLKTANINKGDFQWSTHLNLSIPRNRLVAFPNLDQSTYAGIYEIGKPTTIRKVYRYLGIDPETGLYRFEDVDNDGEITQKDRTMAVDVGTRMFGGISNRIQYKNWSLDVLFQFVKQTAYTPDFYGDLLGIARNVPARAADYFSADNPNASYQKPSTGWDSQAYQKSIEYRASNAVIQDASYIRLKSAQLMYALPPFISGKVGASVYLQGFNLVTFTRFWGSDPETVGALMPAFRTVAAGFMLNF